MKYTRDNYERKKPDKRRAVKKTALIAGVIMALSVIFIKPLSLILGWLMYTGIMTGLPVGVVLIWLLAGKEER